MIANALRFKPGQLPKGISFWNPLALFCTWFGAGLLPKVPGTWGSAAALPFAALIERAFGSIGLAVAAFILFVAGSLVAGRFARASGVKDPGAVVVDEVAAQWATLIPVPLDPILYLVGFVLFRVADVTKPWPANWCDRHLEGGLGVMADDMVSAGYAAVGLWAFRHWVWG